MKKRILSILLILTMILALLPVTASAASADLPDWYFLFAIFKNVDSDYADKDGAEQHIKYTMTQAEIDYAKENAQNFEEYMSQVGVMRAHVDVVEIDAPITELRESLSGYGSYFSAVEAAPLLKDKVDLDQYDHVTCVTSLNVHTGYAGMTGPAFENGTGQSCLNLVNREYCMNTWRTAYQKFPSNVAVHEFLHFMENIDEKWGSEFVLHDVENQFYSNGSKAERRITCYADIILNQAKGNAGTGVHPAAWQYPPRVLRTISELSVPYGVTGIGSWAFQGLTALSKLTIPSSVVSIGKVAFQNCTGLTEVTVSSGLTSIETWAFGNCTALTSVSLPASVTSIGYAAFWNTGIKDVYYGGTQAQWNAIQFGEYNKALTSANIHYNSSLMTDVKPTDFFAQPVQWALENRITVGTGDGKFSPYVTCTQGEILTFLWRAKGSPTPAGAVTGNDFYSTAVQWAKERELIDETFSANDPCTRAMVVTYLWKLDGRPSAGTSNFTDVPADAPYAQAVAWAVSKNITSGTGDNAFSPDTTCTRGEIVTFLYRALG